MRSLFLAGGRIKGGKEGGGWFLFLAEGLLLRWDKGEGDCGGEDKAE